MYDACLVENNILDVIHTKIVYFLAGNSELIELFHCFVPDTCFSTLALVRNCFT